MESRKGVKWNKMDAFSYRMVVMKGGAKGARGWDVWWGAAGAGVQGELGLTWPMGTTWNLRKA